MSIFNPMDTLTMRFRVRHADGRLEVEQGWSERRSAGFVSWIPGLLLTTAAVLLGRWVVRRWRKPANPRAFP